MQLEPHLPIYEAIKQEIKRQIESGQLDEGDRVPSELALAEELGVSRGQTRQALRDLEHEGYLLRSPGRGSFVAPAHMRHHETPKSEWPMVAIACPHVRGAYTGQLLEGFIDAAASLRYHTMTYYLDFNRGTELRFLMDIERSGASGLAFWPQCRSPEEFVLLARFNNAGFPCVLVDRHLHEVKMDYVVSDNRRGLCELTKRLIERGHTDIAYITLSLTTTAIADRLDGFRQGLEEGGLGFRQGRMGIVRGEWENVMELSDLIVNSNPRPTACCFSDDVTMTRVVGDLRERYGYRIPEDLEVATVDDNSSNRALDYPCVVAEQNGYQIGREAAELLLKRVAHPRRDSENRYIPIRVFDSPLEAASQQWMGAADRART